MNSKIFAIMFVLLFSAAFAFTGPGPSSGDDDDDTFLLPLFMNVNSSCDGNVITLTTTDDVPVEGANVVVWIVAGPAIVVDSTDENGHVYFERCDASVEIDANKEGYISINNHHAELINCLDCREVPVPEPCECGYLEEGECIHYECCSDSECSEDKMCDDNSCVPRPECYDDSDCMDTDYCLIAAGAAGGTCNPATGSCGYAYNHSWVMFNCGSADNNCTECAEGYECQLQNGTPPSYECVLIPAAPEEPEEEEKPTALFGDDVLIAALLLLLIIAVLLGIYLKKRSERSKKES